MPGQPAFLPFYLFVVGTCVGSFLNVCIFRIPAGKSIVFPGSFCPSCKTAIPFYLNLPLLSYILLRGRCRRCRSRISPRYPLVELLTGVFCLLIFNRFGLSAEGAVWFVFCGTLIVVSFIDFDHQIIPDRISLPGIPVFGALAFFFLKQPIADIAYGILLGGGILYAVAWVYYKLKHIQGMGGGDIKLLAMIGAVTGPQGVLFTLFSGSLLGTIAGIAAMAGPKSADRKLRIPFGPYLSLGAMVYGLYGDGIIRWYVSMFH